MVPSPEVETLRPVKTRPEKEALIQTEPGINELQANSFYASKSLLTISNSKNSTTFSWKNSKQDFPTEPLG